MEYIIWGVPKGKEYEEVLHTLSKTLDAAKRTMQIISEDFGATNMRIQVLDLNEKPDFIKAILS